MRQQARCMWVGEMHRLCTQWAESILLEVTNVTIIITIIFIIHNNNNNCKHQSHDHRLSRRCLWWQCHSLRDRRLPKQSPPFPPPVHHHSIHASTPVPPLTLYNVASSGISSNNARVSLAHFNLQIFSAGVMKIMSCCGGWKRGGKRPAGGTGRMAGLSCLVFDFESQLIPVQVCMV